LENKASESISDTQNQLQALINQKKFKDIQGMVIGRFQRDSKATKDILMKVIRTKEELRHIPVVANVDFGHTIPIVTFQLEDY
jgi:muramoyltetrapeptide carboxypeptidase